jgi:hypothetical protein
VVIFPPEGTTVSFSLTDWATLITGGAPEKIQTDYLQNTSLAHYNIVFKHPVALL